MIPMILLLATRMLMFLAQPYANEDAYITFRYAANLVAGHGLTFNPGQHVMGFTSPLWTVWSALGIAVHADPVRWTQITSIVADACTLTLGVEVLAAAVSRQAAWAFAAFFAVWPLFAASAVSGLEMNVELCLIVLSAVLAERRSRWAGLTLGLLAISRPEGLLAAIVLSLRASVSARAVAIAIVGATAAALMAYFHSVVPQSVLAKVSMYGMPGPWAGRHWWDWLVPFPLARYPISSEGYQLLPLALVFTAALVQGVRQLWPARTGAVALIGVSGLAGWLAYSALGVAYFWWYMTVPMACLAWVAAAGFPEVVRGRLVPAMCALFLVGTWSMGFPLYLGRAQTEYTNFVSVARFLQTNAQPEDVVLLEPIGMIGYQTRLPILDEIGLVTPETVRRRLAGAGWYADLIAEHRPTWLVTRADLFESPAGFAGAGAPFRDRGERESMLAHYQRLWPSSPITGISMQVFRRRD